MESWLDFISGTGLQSFSTVVAVVLSIVGAMNVILKDKGGHKISREQAEASLFKTNIDASNANTKTAMELNDKLNLEIVRLNKELTEEKDDNYEWETWHMFLVSNWEQVRKSPIVPPKPQLKPKD